MVKEIPLTKGAIALVDDEDYYYLSKISWHLHSGGYAVGKHPETKKLTYMHRIIMGAKDGEVVDHANHLKYDNRKENLRLCTQKENAWNSRGVEGKSRFKGVALSDKVSKPWFSRIRVDDGVLHLGYYKTEEEAAYAYDLAAKKYYGEFAYLNNVHVPNFEPFKPRKTASNKRGVTWCNTKKRWRTTIKINRKSIHLGYFREESDAIAAREVAEMKYFGKLLEENK